MAHVPTVSSAASAHAARIPQEELAKAVVMKDAEGYLMVIIPADHRVDMESLRAELQRDIRFAGESELRDLFCDCALGAIPPLGNAYGIETLVDEGIRAHADVYFEAGDHRELVHIPTERFLDLLGPARRARLASPRALIRAGQEIP